jgi:signal peptidase
VIRLALNVVVFAALGAAAVAVVAVTAPYVAGGRSYTVMSGSMEPRIHTGDVVADERVRADRIAVGDIVTFPDPQTRGRLITHRVRSVRVHGDRVSVVTKGDANTATEHWSIAATGDLGRVRYRVAKVGYLLAFTRRPTGRMALVVVPALALTLLELARIWGRRPEEVRVEPA